LEKSQNRPAFWQSKTMRAQIERVDLSLDPAAFWCKITARE